MFLLYIQGIHQKPQYQIHLKSESGPIYVLLVNKDADSTSPVVVQVPPPSKDGVVIDASQSQNTDPSLSSTATTQIKKEKTQVSLIHALMKRICV